MAKPEVKSFNVFCHYDEENKPVFHTVTIDKKGAVKLHGHPEIKSEVYYHLLMVQKEKVESSRRYYYGGVPYKVSGCLQFYFSLIHKKFEEHLNGIHFVHKEEGCVEYYRGDNERLNDYLEKIKYKTRRRDPFDRNSVWSEEVFLKRNQANIESRLKAKFRDAFYRGIEPMSRYIVSLDFVINNSLQTENGEKYTFRCYMSQRCSSTQNTWKRDARRRDGYMSVSIAITSAWYKEVNKEGLSCITTEKHGKLFVLSAKKQRNGYLVDAILPAAGTKKAYIIQTFYIEKNVVTGAWEATRKNKVKQRVRATLPEKEADKILEEVPLS